MLAQDERSTTHLDLDSQAAGTSPASPLSRPATVKAGLTAKQSRRQVENDEYSAFVRRILRAYASATRNARAVRKFTIETSMTLARAAGSLGKGNR
jgi:hypothetical protein